MKKNGLVLFVTLMMFATNGEHVSPGPEVVSVVPRVVATERTGPTRAELFLEYRNILLAEIRTKHLMTVSKITWELSSRIVTEVIRHAELYELDPDLILGLIIVESDCREKVVSIAGALGLMQVMPGTGKFISRHSGLEWRGSKGLSIAENNIAYGIWYLNYLRMEFSGNERVAITAYYWGPENIRTRIRKSERLPQVYPDKVYAATEKLRGVIWNEYDSRYWRGVDQYVRDAHQRRYTTRSQTAGVDCSIPLNDGQGVCGPVKRRVPAD